MTDNHQLPPTLSLPSIGSPAAVPAAYPVPAPLPVLAPPTSAASVGSTSVVAAAMQMSPTVTNEPARALRLRGAIRHVFDDRFTSPAVALVGPNSSGKTSRMMGVVLPLEGARHGGGKVEDLIPPGMDFAYSAVDWSDGRSFQFDTRTAWSKPEGAPMVVRPATWLVAKGRAGVLEEVVARWGGADAVRSLDAPAALTDVQKGAWTRTLSAIQKALREEKRKTPTADIANDPASILSQMGTVLRSLKDGKGKEVKAFATAIAAIASEATSGAEDEKRLADELEYARRYSSVEGWRKQQAEISLAVSAYQAAAAAFGSLPPVPDRAALAEAHRLASARASTVEVGQSYLYEMLRRITTEGETLLPGIPFESISGFDRYALYNVAMGEWHRVEHLVAEVKVERDRAAHDLALVDDVQRRREDERSALVREYERISRASGDIANGLAGFDRAPAGTVADLQVRLDGAKAAGVRRSERQKLVEQKAKAESELRDIKAVEQAAQIEYTKLVERVAGGLNTAVRARLSLAYQDRFHFDIASGVLEMVGVDGRPHDWRNQGGGEYVELTLALARAWASDERAVLVLEYERDLAALSTIPGPRGEPSALATVLRGIAEAAHRGELVMVVVASPTPLPIDPRLWQTIATAHQEVPAASEISQVQGYVASIIAQGQEGRASLPMGTAAPIYQVPAPIYQDRDQDPQNVFPIHSMGTSGPFGGGADLGPVLPLPLMDMPLPSILGNEPPPLPLGGPPRLPSALPVMPSPPVVGSYHEPPTRRVLDRLADGASQSSEDWRRDVDAMNLLEGRTDVGTLNGADDAGSLNGAGDFNDDDSGLGDDEAGSSSDGEEDPLAAAATKAVKSKRKRKSPKSSTRARKRK